MPKTLITVGPGDHGRRMSLEHFDQAEGQEGYRYELGRGVIAVVEVPDPRHFAQVDAISLQLADYRLAHPGQIHRLGGGGDCKILLADLATERHPDVAIYKTAPPEGDNPWARWVPEIVLEVVSPTSAHRDYEEKPDEYLHFGVRDYWILDAERQEMLVLRRRGRRWTRRIVRPPDVYHTPLLPGLEFACGPVFEAAQGR
ncbi:MAG: Uma2 family endonuclease [Planctomycetes bacterium]|nr:Uma2 family endonuclease [Planctomycetota bacterium]